MTFSFKVDSKSGAARAGTLELPHGTVQTPIFMPVGTVGTVKGLAPDDLRDCGAQIVLGNTYHLMLRPGADRLARLGGLHKFMQWDRPLLTDSGGFQVFSLASGKARGKSASAGNGKPLVKIDDDGVTFKSHLDGSTHRMSPEDSMDIQMKIGADIIMAFDQCPPGDASREDVLHAMSRTSAWLRRCMTAMTKPDSRLFGIIQGGIYDDLREQHVDDICSTDLFGYAIGGLSVGEKKEDMMRILDVTCHRMPDNKPRYLMGVGTPEDLLDGIARGVDMFDCVMPTRNARNGTFFTSQGKLSIKRAEYKEDESPLDSQCNCYTCRTFSRAYLHHLFKAQEILFHRLGSLHNIHFYLQLVRDARKAIVDGTFDAFRQKCLSDFQRDEPR